VPPGLGASSRRRLPQSTRRQPARIMAATGSAVDRPCSSHQDHAGVPHRTESLVTALAPAVTPQGRLLLEAAEDAPPLRPVSPTTCRAPSRAARARPPAARRRRGRHAAPAGVRLLARVRVPLHQRRLRAAGSGHEPHAHARSAPPADQLERPGAIRIEACGWTLSAAPGVG
jgi:hypothetical protein